MWQVHNNCFLHFISLLTKKYPTVHVILLFRSVWEFRPYAQGPCRTHTVGPHAYGLANFTLLTHIPYKPFRTRMVYINEPQHEKTNKLTCAPIERKLRSAWASAQSDQSLRSLCAQWIAMNTRVLHADSDGSSHTVRKSSQIWVFAGRTGHFVGFVMLRLKWQ